jgi:hypothetical protein
VADASAALKSLAPELPSAARAQIDSVTSSLESSVAQLQTPKRVLSAAQMPTGATNSTPSVGSPITGWIFVGHVDATKAAWSQQPTTVANPTPVFQAGDVLAINDDVYVRADTSGGGPHNQAPVVGVIRAGGKVRVVATPEYAHALRGGWFLWLKVTAL